MECILLVNERDEEFGFADKLEVHKKGLLHRAFSIIIMNAKNRILIQRRAIDKYHSGGLWSNSCCSHQKNGENLEKAIHARLIYELGFDCKLKKILKFKYLTKFENGLIEHEIDHVFIGHFNGTPRPNYSEVADVKWVDYNTLVKDIQSFPEKYTYWFKIVLEKLDKAIFGELSK